MKTHPESIFVKLSDIADLGIDGAGHIWGTNEDVSNRPNVTEFVPAAAYIELKTLLEKRESQLSQAITCAGKAIGEVIGLKSQLQTQTENMLKLREFVEKVANSAFADELAVRAQDLIMELSR